MKNTDLESVTHEQFYGIIRDYGSRKRLERIYDPAPYFVYLALKDWFGTPLERVASFRDQWHFYILTPSLALDVYDWKRDSVSVGVYDRNHTSDIQIEAEITDFLTLLKQEAAGIRTKIKTVQPQAFSFRLVNPFHVFFTNAEKLYERTLDEDKDENQAELDDLMARDQDFIQAALFLYVASFEALLNLIYEIYLKPALRHGDPYGHIRRAPILTRLQLAPTCCTCFKIDAFNTETDEFRHIRAVFELRNRYIHANITEPLKTPLIEEDGCEFWLPDRQYDAHNLPLAANAMRARHLDFVRESILNMVNLIVTSMKPRHRKPFSEALGLPIFFLDSKGDGYDLSLPVSG